MVSVFMADKDRPKNRPTDSSIYGWQGQNQE